MAKHSPGTWSFGHENGDNPRIVTDAIDPGTGKPCVITNLTCSMRAVGDDVYSETMANAQLFAASKAMLEVLKSIRQKLDPITCETECGEIDTAIAQAEGLQEARS